MSRTLKRFLISLVVGIALIVLIGRLVDQFVLSTNLNWITGSANFSRTKILFAYPGNPATIWDPYNKLYKVYSGRPDSISIKDSTRLVLFTEPVILKSNTDSIEIGQDYARFAGYMGIWTDARKFLISDRGEVYPSGSMGYVEQKY